MIRASGRRGVVRPFVARRAQAARERLTFGFGPDTVPGRGLVDAALAQEPKPTFATAAYAEPRDWGYGGLMAFTAVLMLRPQDTFPFLNPLHLAETCAIIELPASENFMLKPGPRSGYSSSWNVRTSGTKFVFQ